MELVNVNLYAYGYYSEATYEDNIWIKKSSYEKKIIFHHRLVVENQMENIVK